MTADDTLALWILVCAAIGGAIGAGLWLEYGLPALGIAAGAGLGIIVGAAIHAVRNED